jgi:hypothetical protein
MECSNSTTEIVADFSCSLTFAKELTKQWTVKEPKKSIGGLNALSGFRYQFFLSLLEVVTRVLKEGLQVGTIELGVFTEMLSDALCINNKKIAIIQSKLTANTANIAACLNDYWNIWNIAKDINSNPDFILSFEIIVNRTLISDFNRLLTTWKPEGGGPIASDLQLFKTHIVFKINRNPEMEIYNLLAKLLPGVNPIKKCEEWLGILLNGSINLANITKASEQIWGDLVSLSKSKEPPSSCYLFSEFDLPPTNIEIGPYLYGQSPTLKHLREGYFASRPKLVNEVFDDFNEWVKTHPAARDISTRIPVYWIRGRSGSGKSILLLELLAQIYRNDCAPIIWLGQHADNIVQGINLVQSMTNARPFSIIALDDPYSPNSSSLAYDCWRSILPNLHAARERGDYSAISIFICCGPTEQAERLYNDYPDQFNIKTWELPTESLSDFIELRTWFTTRTGREPPKLEDKNILLVQLFFEWKTGEPLHGFSIRFKKRIEAAGGANCVNLIEKILCLNRLYIGYPISAIEHSLTPLERETIDRLMEESHLGKTMSADRHGVWIAHPHLSNAIYNSWYSPEHNSRVRFSHLIDSATAAILYEDSPAQKLALLWLLSRFGIYEEIDETTKGRMAGINIQELIEQIYAKFNKIMENNIPVWSLPVWIQSIAAFPRIQLIPSPMDATKRALENGDTTQTGLRLLCHKILQHRNRFSETDRIQIEGLIKKLIIKEPTWHEWAAIVSDMLYKTLDQRIAILATEWLVAHPSAGGAQKLYSTILLLFPGLDCLEEVFNSIIPFASNEPSWGDTIINSIKIFNNPTSMKKATEWIQKNIESETMAFHFRYLLDGNFDSVNDLAIEWLKINFNNKYANYVLEQYYKQDNIPCTFIIECTKNWIKSNHKQAGKLIKFLLKTFPDKDTSELALNWIANAQADDQTIVFAWEGLTDQFQTQSQSINDVIIWLQSFPETTESWPFIWEAIWRTNRGIPKLKTIGINWLRVTNPDSITWKYVWQNLWETYPTDETVKNLGLSWLRKTSKDHQSWKYIWNALWSKNKYSRDLVEIGETWLITTNPIHGGWQFVWEELWLASRKSEKLSLIGFTWLQTTSIEHHSWTFVWEKLWGIKFRQPEMRTIGLNWLSTVLPTNASWQYIWEHLLADSAIKTSLLDIGENWLAIASPSHNSWPKIWQSLRNLK